MKTKSALSYFGSDSQVACEIAAMLNHCKHVTIPFCGGMSILPHLTARAIVANDLNNDVYTFYKAASGAYGERTKDELIGMCKSTLSHPIEMKLAEAFLSGQRYIIGPARAAWAYWAMCWLGRKGKGGTKYMGGDVSVRWTANGGTNASRLRAAADDLESWAKQFERCEFTCLDFRNVLEKVSDSDLCGVYCDPPWVGAGDDYLCKLSEDDDESPEVGHEKLEQMLRRFQKTTIVVRYGDNPLIRKLYRDWNIIEASSRTQANSVKGELWITNK